MLLHGSGLAVSLRKGPGFPGVPGRYEWFGVDFQGTVAVNAPGVYSFRLSSDDGAKLYVDDVLVLTNDGLHDVVTVEGAVRRSAGSSHRVRIPYWNGPGPMALTLEVARPGEGYEVLRRRSAVARRGSRRSSAWLVWVPSDLATP